MTDKEFLEKYDVNEYDRPSFAVDDLIFSVDCKGNMQVLLCKRTEAPFEGCYGLNGTFVKMDENLDDCAKRVAREKFGIEDIELEQLYTYGEVNRDPRTRVISTVYVAIVSEDKCRNLKENCTWFNVNLSDNEFSIFNKPIYVMEMRKETMNDLINRVYETNRCYNALVTIEDIGIDFAFDHKSIIKDGIERLRGKIQWSDIAFNGLEDKNCFTIYELQRIFEAVNGYEMDTPNFRRWFEMNYVKTNKVSLLDKNIVRYAKRPSKCYKKNS